jgi:hypothetical protein
MQTQSWSSPLATDHTVCRFVGGKSALIAFVDRRFKPAWLNLAYSVWFFANLPVDWNGFAVWI